MLSKSKFEFNKENVDLYLKDVAKEYRKLTGKTVPAELTVIGGASVLINYGFRDMTTDIDAIIDAASSMKDAINIVADRYDLPAGWLNADFKNTDSYIDKLIMFSKYYRTFSNVVTIRTIDAEYLIAMKLKSGRRHKNDFSDILGILDEHEKKGDPIDLDRIKAAYENLYGSWDTLQESSLEFILDILSCDDYQEMYRRLRESEKEHYQILLAASEGSQSHVKEASAEYIVSSLKSMQSK